VTACTAHPYSEHHDYSQPPHNTPEDPRDTEFDGDLCQSWCSDGCDDRAGRLDAPGPYRVTLYQPGTHDWIRMLACVPCTAQLRAGPRPSWGSGSGGIARITEVRGEEVMTP
jgi:hypothetical protein